MLRAVSRVSPVIATRWSSIQRSGSFSALNSGNRQHYSILSFLPSKKKLVPRGSRAAPPSLPPPKYIDIEDRCKLEYVNIPPRNENHIDHQPVTIVLLHGAPGSYHDFRYLIPLVQRPGVRIIGINLPGYEGSTVSKSHYLESISALPTAQLTFLRAATTLWSEER